jgi:hypothetical protein
MNPGGKTSMKYQKGASGAVEVVSFTGAERVREGDSTGTERSSSPGDDDIDRAFDGMASSVSGGKARIIQASAGREIAAGYLAASTPAPDDQRPTSPPPARVSRFGGRSPSSGDGPAEDKRNRASTKNRIFEVAQVATPNEEVTAVIRTLTDDERRACRVTLRAPALATRVVSPMNAATLVAEATPPAARPFATTSQTVVVETTPAPITRPEVSFHGPSSERAWVPSNPHALALRIRPQSPYATSTPASPWIARIEVTSRPHSSSTQADVTQRPRPRTPPRWLPVLFGGVAATLGLLVVQADRLPWESANTAARPPVVQPTAAVPAAPTPAPTALAPAPARLAVNLVPVQVRSDSNTKWPVPETKVVAPAEAPPAPPRAAEPVHVAPPPPAPPHVAPTLAATADRPAVLSGRVLGNEDD